MGIGGILSIDDEGNVKYRSRSGRCIIIILLDWIFRGILDRVPVLVECW